MFHFGGEGANEGSVIPQGSRINMTPAKLRAILDSRDQMQAELWANISPALLAEIEAGMYRHARDQLLVYWAESQPEA